MRNKYFLIIGLYVGLIGGARMAVAADMVDISVGNQQESITLEVPDTTGRKVFLVPNPNRLVVDVASIPGQHKVAMPAPYRGNLIKGLRFGQFDPRTSRFVFDLSRAVRVADVKVEHSRLVIQILPADQSASVSKGEDIDNEIPAFPTQQAPGKARVAVSAPAETVDRKPQQAMAAPEKASVHHKDKVPDKAKVQVAAKPHKVGKPIVVIDAGHGGVDPGTIGPNGAYEKDLTLAYAKMLKAKLLKSGRYQVRLTREDDSFIMLRKRVAIARAAGANLFISLHADSAPEAAARGLSVYTVSEKASDKETAALANRENKADVLAGVDLSDERGDVASILISLAERDTMNRSASLADELVTTLDDKVRLLQNSHRFAGFAVLKAPDIPSVLIEIGFLSSEEKMLTSKAYRERVTGGIAAGVDAYFAEQKRVGNL